MANSSNAVARLAEGRLVKFGAALLFGLCLGAMLSPSPIALPAVGTTSTMFVGAAAVIAGGGLYVALDRRSGADCGCGGDCGC